MSEETERPPGNEFEIHAAGLVISCSLRVTDHNGLKTAFQTLRSLADSMFGQPDKEGGEQDPAQKKKPKKKRNVNVGVEPPEGTFDARVLALLRGAQKEMTYVEIADELDVKTAMVALAVGRLRKRELIT